jgi:prepilin-type N-terminal cleavage/methylation domain-containing protein
MKAGFTLIEFVVVVAVIAILSSVIIPHTEHFFRRSRDAKRLSNMETLSIALNSFYDDQGRYPNYTQDGVGRSYGSGECIGPALAGTAVCFWDGNFEEVMAAYVRGSVPIDPLYTARPGEFFYAYDNGHQVNWCDFDPSNDSGGAIYPVLGFRRAETEAAKNVHRDTCCPPWTGGGDMELCWCDYNIMFPVASDDW